MTDARHPSLRAFRERGFATATILVVIAIIGSTALWSSREALTGRTLANARLFQARAMALAGIGLQQAAQRLRSQPQSAGLSWMQATAVDQEQTLITTRLLHADHLPPGFSADRFVEYHHEVTGRAASGLSARVTQTMGIALLSVAASESDPPTACVSPRPLPIQVRVGGGSGPVVAALLLTGTDPVLSIVAADSGQLLWSAGPAAGATQPLFDANTRISTSLTALDTDSDGLHDRIYAGDHAGRIWRLDLRNGNDAERFAVGSVFADLATAASARAFVAAPDASLAFDGAGAAWLNIAIGTTGSSGANRFFVLRDHAPRAQWSAAEHQHWRALHEQDLHAQAVPADAAAPAGYYVDLGAAQVFTPSITMDGKVTFLATENAVRSVDDCIADIGIRTLSLADDAQDQRSAHARIAAGIPLRALLENGENGQDHLQCTLADTAQPQCSGFDPVRRRWWRREDAD